MLLVAGLGAFGVFLLATYPSLVADRDRYNGLPRCASGAPIESQDCWSWRVGTVTAVGDTHTALGARVNVITVGLQTSSAFISAEPTTTYTCTTPGQAAELKFWKGSLTGVYTRYGLIPTPVNPNLTGPLWLEGGVLLVALALLVPVDAALSARRARRHPVEPVPQLLARPLVRFSAVVFGIGQFADVVTSALGQRAGLLEANPVVENFVSVTGPLGFLLIRLPLIALALMAVFRLPRTIIIGVLLGCGLYFTAVGYQNFHLAVAAAGPPVACPQVRPLP